MTADPWGIVDGYEDARGIWRPISDGTRRALLAAMGIDPGAPPDAPREVRIILHGERRRLPAAGDLTLEDGHTVTVDTALPPDLPLGYHQLHDRNGHVVSIIVAPRQCHAPPPRAWGWAVQLYAARSSASWGIGDFADLHRLAGWASGLGGRVLVVNPLHPPVPREKEDPSPYAPSSRRYRNPLYLRIEDVPGAREFSAEVAGLQAAAHALNGERRIDRQAVGALKRQAAELLWARFRGDADFDRYVHGEGGALETFAAFCALAEHHRQPWHRWPEEHRRPDSPGVARFVDGHRARVHFHQWIQWLLDRQLARAAREIAIVHDFPVGVDPDGADAWAWQDVLARGASVGAPPDRYNRRGQDWGLPPFVPHRLRAHRYAPFVQTLRAALRHGGGLRMDHVMGLFRLFWVPHGLEPAAGGYVRYPADELLAILTLESHRAGAFIVGEDLGTVEAGVRERLAERGVLSTRVFWFESDPPERWPERALATITTHDLPTIAGLWRGTDAAAQQTLGLEPNAAAYADDRRRIAALTGVGEGAAIERVIEETYRALAQAPSVVITATLEDALGVEERPNMPGTTTGWPNWSLALPAPLEALDTAPLPRAIARALDRRRPGSAPTRPAGDAAPAASDRDTPPARA